MKFSYNLPVNLLFGRGRLNKIGIYCKDYGKRALIVTGMHSTTSTGVLDRLVEYLNQAEIENVIFKQVPQNPLTTTALEAAQVAVDNECDMVIGIGGGSIMDCAKAAAFMAVNEGDINDYIFNKKKSDKALPIILIPTTCGTGSEGNGFAVLTNPETGDKKSLRCNAIVAKLSIIDSELMMTMPKHILASVGFDALCHCIEAYISTNGQPLTDIMCEEGIRLISENLLTTYNGVATPDSWDAITFASTLGGMAINTAGVTVAHGMEHPVSGLRNVVHGRGLAALTPVVMEETIDVCKEKCAFISRCLGGKDENDCVLKIKEFLEALELNTNLTELGITEKDIDWLTENCFKVSAAGIGYHPKKFSQNDIKRIYKKAL